MAEEVVVTSNQNEESAPSRLGSILIGILLVVAAFLAYNFFQGEPAPANNENDPSPTEQAQNPGQPNGEGQVLGESYVVRQGDTLWSIARERLGDGNRWKEIADANNLSNPIDLEVGTSLTIPSGEVAAATTPSPAPTQPNATPTTPASTPGATVEPTPVSTGLGAPNPGTTPSTSVSDVTYTVQKGDTLWSIAQKYYGDGNQWKKIFDHSGNNLSVYTAKNGTSYPIIHQGNVITIPGATQGS